MNNTIFGTKPRRATSMEDTRGDHPICHAVTSGQAGSVRKLIENGADINFKGIDGRSPLALAARQGTIALVQMLISLGANQLSYDRFFHRPAANAASQGHHAIADCLLQKLGKYSPIRMNHTIRVEIQWMLLYAAKEGNEKRIRSCLSKGADINFQLRGEPCTPLCGTLVSAPRVLRVVKLLLDRGADPNIALPAKKAKKTNPGGWKPPSSPPLSLAMLCEESLQLINVLLKAGADAGQCGLALFDAVRLEKAAEFRLLVDHHADLYVRLKGRSLAECARQSDC